jgi:alanine-glyoxylate transaminase/serine-glyoxylate transaminase/serine-pyruvate transaminase
MMADNEYMLMIPGPIQPEEEVMKAMGGAVQAHYGAEWTVLYKETTEMLKEVFGTQGDVYIIVGAGTAAIDAGIGSSLAAGEKIVVGVNGFFGERLKCVAESYNLDVVTVTGEWGQPLKVELFEKALRQHPDARAVAVTHLETSTTIANPVVEIGTLTRGRGVLFMVDAVSSLGGLPVKMDEWGIDLCASASQKCLGAPPGLAPVAVGKRAWEMIDRNPMKGHGFYLNLRVWRQYATEWADWHPTPITMATNNVLALRAGLTSLLREGIAVRAQRYQQLALRLREGLRRIGMPPFTPDELMVPIITAAYGPPGVATSRIVSYMAEERRIKIAGGLGVLKDKIFRVGHMSPTVSEDDIDKVVEALASFK